MKAPKLTGVEFWTFKEIVKKQDVFCNIYIPHVFKEVNCKFI